MAAENEKNLLSEVQSLMTVITEDREAQKKKELAERWTKWVSLWVVFLAVGGALTSQQQTSFSGKSTRELNQAAIEQGLATNTWSYYQSVSIKAHLYGIEAQRKAEGVATEAAAKKTAAAQAPGGQNVIAAGSASAAGSAHANAAGAGSATGSKVKKAKPTSGAKVVLPAHIQAKLDKYDAQKTEILGQGRVHDAQRDVHRVQAETDSKHSRALGLAMSALQVAVAMASISILGKRRSLFLLSVLAGLLAIAQAVNGVLGWWV